MGPALSLFDDSPRRAWSAGVLSTVAHLGLLWAIAAGTNLLPPKEPLSSLRFVGQTFDIDALGDDQKDEASASGDASSPSTTATEDAVPPSPEEVPADQSPPSESTEPTAKAAKPEARPEAAPPEAAPPPFQRTPAPQAEQDEPSPAPADAPAQAQPQQPKKPVDPFDLGLPGEPSSGASPAAPSETGSYGAEGDDAPVTDVFKAFLHLFPEANRHNPAWHALPQGSVGRIEFFIHIGKNARLVSIEVARSGEVPPPPILIEALRKTQTYLHHQRLGWEGERREGRQRLALTMKIEKKSPHAVTPDREGTQRHGRYGESRPTGAFFTYYDGHHVDIELERLP